MPLNERQNNYHTECLISFNSGNVAHILAIVSIFFAVKLGKAELPEWMDFILVAYVAFHVIIHLIYSVSLPSKNFLWTNYLLIFSHCLRMQNLVININININCLPVYILIRYFYGFR